MARNRNKETQDINGEKAVHMLLNEYFYPSVSNYIDCNDIENQFHGIDTRFTFNGLDYLCDEKAALDYTNNQKGYPLTTFCLELSFLNRKNDEMEGWFTDSGKTNNAYLFVWIDKSEHNVINSPEEIIDAEIMLVWKNDIYDYLRGLGWDVEKLRRKSFKIRNDDNEPLGDYVLNGCKFSYAKYLPEKPINLLIKRKTYASMPHTITYKYKKNSETTN